MKSVQMIPSVYSPSGWEILRPEPGTMPEQTNHEREAARVANQISYSKALKEYRLTPTQFDALQSTMPSIFPKPIAHEKSGGTLTNPLGTKREAVFTRDAFAAFFARTREFASWVPR
jgi:hypothetical protein